MTERRSDILAASYGSREFSRISLDRNLRGFRISLAGNQITRERLRESEKFYQLAFMGFRNSAGYQPSLYEIRENLIRPDVDRWNIPDRRMQDFFAKRKTSSIDRIESRAYRLCVFAYARFRAA